MRLFDDPIAVSRTTSSLDVTEAAKPYRGRRMSWAEFYREREDLQPANDNEAGGGKGFGKFGAPTGRPLQR